MLKWIVFAVLFAVAAAAPAQQSESSNTNRWLLTGTRLYLAPDAPPLDNAWVLVADGKIEAVGEASAAKPKGVRIDSACSGGVIAAGFQNSHVHFLDAAYDDAANRPASELEQALTRMVTRYGFTAVVDTGSIIENIVALRRRIERGDVKGPAILTASTPLFPQNGLPFYLSELSPAIVKQFPLPATPDEAVAVVRRNFAAGANGTKLFIATPLGDGKIKRMSADIARAAAAETHARGGLVMAHPTDPEGAAAAVAAGVDILVHTTIDGPKPVTWSADLIRDMRAHEVSVVPTLKLWHYELDKEKVPAKIKDIIVGDAQKQLKAFADAGGQVLFGTDVGYMSDFDPTEEYVLMAQAGLTPMQILTSLTTAPAARWKAGERRGRVRAGFAADLVVLNGDPVTDVRRFADVKCTIRGGRALFVRN